MDVAQPRQTSSIREEQDANSNEKVHTIYSVLQPPRLSAAKPESCEDVKEQPNTEEASTSPSARVTGTEIPSVDTVYSMLQKPKGLRPQQP